MSLVWVEGPPASGACNMMIVLLFKNVIKKSWGVVVEYEK